MVAYYSLVIIGLCLLMGYAGQISLGHAGFFSIGAYVSALLTTYNLVDFADNPMLSMLAKVGILSKGESLYGEVMLTVHPWIACLIAVTASLLIALAIGKPILRLKGHYLAMGTLGFGIIIHCIVMATPFFGEADGISEVPPFTILPGVVVSGDFTARAENYYIAWIMVVIAMWLLINLINSRVGRGLRAIHGSEEAAESLGVDTARYKLFTFVISAVLAAVAGVFLTHFNGGVGPSEANIMQSVRYVALVAVGGMASLWGALTMGVVLNFMSLRGVFGTYDDAVFGLILVGVMLFAPNGIIGLLTRKKAGRE
jgi:branched-chain amino acid transport system permease protein